MTPEQAVRLITQRCEALGGIPAEVILTDRGDEATEAVKKWLQQRGCKVVMKKLDETKFQTWLAGRADTPQMRAIFAAQPGLTLALSLAGPKPARDQSGKTTVAQGALSWAVLSDAAEPQHSGEDHL